MVAGYGPLLPMATVVCPGYLEWGLATSPMLPMARKFWARINSRNGGNGESKKNASQAFEDVFRIFKGMLKFKVQSEGKSLPRTSL